MSRKIAILARDRQSEAFRMSGGLIMMDDTIDVFVLDRKVSDDASTQANLELVKEMGLTISTNSKENADIPFISTEDLAARLLEYDIIDPY